MSEANVMLSRENFLADRQGNSFADVFESSPLVVDEILDFFSDGDRQRRMEESEIHHDRSPLAGVIRELEACPEVDRFLGDGQPERSKRLRQAVGVVVRMVMEGRGWKKTGRRGSMGVRAPEERDAPPHNEDGLAFWFLLAERYERESGMPFLSVRDRRAKYSNAKLGLPGLATNAQQGSTRRESNSPTGRPT